MKGCLGVVLFFFLCVVSLANINDQRFYTFTPGQDVAVTFNDIDSSSLGGSSKPCTCSGSSGTLDYTDCTVSASSNPSTAVVFTFTKMMQGGFCQNLVTKDNVINSNFPVAFVRNMFVAPWRPSYSTTNNQIMLSTTPPISTANLKSLIRSDSYLSLVSSDQIQIKYDGNVFQLDQSTSLKSSILNFAPASLTPFVHSIQLLLVDSVSSTPLSDFSLFDALNTTAVFPKLALVNYVTQISVTASNGFATTSVLINIGSSQFIEALIQPLPQ